MSLFITIEGPDGTGKSTLATRLANYLDCDRNHKALYLQDPGSTTLGQHFREYINRADRQDIVPTAELMLFNALKWQMYEEKIAPALQDGTFVVSDRYNMSTYVYQGYLRGDNLNDFFKRMQATAPPDPDLYIVLKGSPAVLKKRLNLRYEAGESQSYYETDDKLERVCQGFSKPSLWTHVMTYSIDTDELDVDQVFHRALAAIRTFVDLKYTATSSVTQHLEASARKVRKEGAPV